MARLLAAAARLAIRSQRHGRIMHDLQEKPRRLTAHDFATMGATLKYNF